MEHRLLPTGAVEAQRSYFVAEHGREVIGFGGMTLTSDNAAHVLNAAVTPAFHRRQVGTRLFCVLMMDAIARGVETIYLELRAGNVAGYAIYSKFRPKIVVTRKGYYSSPARTGS